MIHEKYTVAVCADSHGMLTRTGRYMQIAYPLRLCPLLNVLYICQGIPIYFLSYS